MAYARAGDPKRGRANFEAGLKLNAAIPEARAAREVLAETKSTTR
jgi:hypothetical protein